MLTEKKLRNHLHRIWFHYYRLQKALEEAHWADVIRYTSENEGECCALHSKLKGAIEKNTKDAIAETIQMQIKTKVRGY